MSHDQPFSIDDLARRYAAGESIRALAASINRSYGFVHRRLSEVMPLRQRGPGRGEGGERGDRRLYPKAQSWATTTLGREHREAYRVLYREQQQAHPDATPSAWQSATRAALRRKFPTRFRELYLAAVADLRAARFEDHPGPDARVKTLTPSGAAGPPLARESSDGATPVRAGAKVTAPPK
jgi:hypothetical protein